jgi:hypothetical protein
MDPRERVRSEIDESAAELVRKIEELDDRYQAVRAKARQLTPRYHIDRHPLAFFAAAVTAGALLAWWQGRPA